MNILCPNNQPCIEDANSLGNFSSEDPDQELFRSTYYPNEIFDDDFDIWSACMGLCTSTISQEDADLCASNNAAICERGRQFGNAAHTCYRTCPDGLRYSFTIPAATFFALSQAQADALAENWCSQYLEDLCSSQQGGPIPSPNLPPARNRDCNDEQTVEAACVDGKRGSVIPACRYWAGNKEAANILAVTVAEDWMSWGIGCLTSLPKSACLGDEINQFVVPDKIRGFERPVSWEVFGIPPNGIQFQEQTTAMRVYGTFSKAGTYGFRLTMTDKNGTYTYRVYYISVMEIDEPSTLTPGRQDSNYSNTISVLGGWDPKVFGLKAGSVLPTGLTLDSSTGVISGVPTVEGTFTFTIVVADNEGGSCEKEFELELLPNLFRQLVWGNSLSLTPLGTGYETGTWCCATIGTSLPAQATAVGGAIARAENLGVSWSINNPNGPVSCRLRISCQKVNYPPPGIQCGSENRLFTRLSPGPVSIVNIPGAVPAGEHIYAFTIPSGVSTWELQIVAQASYAGANPQIGGSSDMQIYLEYL